MAVWPLTLEPYVTGIDLAVGIGVGERAVFGGRYGGQHVSLMVTEMGRSGSQITPVGQV